MTNYEKWLLYTKDLPSPQCYIDFGFYWLISTCLQRRVWYYSGDGALFPNLYVTFVGPPAIGKGVVLGRINTLLRFHKYEKGRPIETNAGPEFPSLFPVGADSITFEELMSDMASSIRRHVTPDNKVYTHTSYAFILEELSSLFKRKTEDVVKFLVNAYDCKGYEYKTKHQGKDIIRSLCLSFIAGTQFGFLKDAHKAGIFGEGFSSRSIFLFATTGRKSKFHISEESEDQTLAKKELLAWLKQLASLYGQIRYSDDTYHWLEDWYIRKHLPRQHTANEKMAEYLGRKKVNLLKLAAAIHFAENLSMIIQLDTFQRALTMLDSVEPAMDAGLNFSGRNELHGYSRKLQEYIEAGGTVGRSKRDIILSFGVQLSLDEIEVCIKELEMTTKLRNKIEKREIIYYL